MAQDYSRIHRLIRVLMLIQSGRGWTAPRLAEECGTSIRNVYRDIKVLEAVGIPLSYNRQMQGYEVRGDFFMPPVELTLDEALAVLALAESAGGASPIPFLSPASRAVAKIRTVLPEQVKRELGDLDSHMDIQLAQGGDTGADAEAVRDVYSRVLGAIHARRALRCQYESPARRHPAAGDEVFLFRPYRLLWSQRAWYVVGFHDGRGEVRQLRLSRFTRCDATDEAYEIPTSFNLDHYLGNAWRMIRGEQRYTIELWFDPSFADTAADTQWHRTQQTQWQEDGSVVLCFEVDGLDEIVWWVLSMGPYCRVRKPRELAERVAELASRTAEQYRQG